MATLVQRLRKRLPHLRAICGQKGFRLRRVFLVTGTWESTGPGDGSEAEETYEILEDGYSPWVRDVDEKRIAIGELDAGSIEIGPITPVEGTPIATLTSSGLTEDQTAHIQIIDTETGESGRYEIINVDRDRPLRVMITAKPIREGY